MNTTDLGLKYVHGGDPLLLHHPVLQCVICHGLALLPCRVHTLRDGYDTCPAVCCRGACSALLLHLPCPRCRLPADPNPHPDAAYCRILEDRATVVCGQCGTCAGPRALLRHNDCPLGRLWSLMLRHHPTCHPNSDDDGACHRGTCTFGDRLVDLHRLVPSFLEAWLWHDWLPRCPKDATFTQRQELRALLVCDWFDRLWTAHTHRSIIAS